MSCYEYFGFMDDDVFSIRHKFSFNLSEGPHSHDKMRNKIMPVMNHI